MKEIRKGLAITGNECPSMTMEVIGRVGWKTEIGAKQVKELTGLDVRRIVSLYTEVPGQRQEQCCRERWRSCS